MLDENFYYGNWKNQYKIIPYLKNREFIYLPSKTGKALGYMKRRNLRVHNIQGLQFWIKFYRLFQNQGRMVNFYYSMAQFRNGLPFLYEKGDIDKEKSEEWNENCHKDIVSYDMLIDIDAGNFNEMDFAVETADILQHTFDMVSIPYRFRFSGMGFHFVIPYKYFPLNLSLNPFDDDNIYKYMRSIAEILNKNTSEMIDFNIYDSRRIAKIPYSLSIYDEGAFVCCPLESVKNFNYEDYKLAKFIKNNINGEDILHNPDGNLEYFENATKKNT